MTFEKTQIRERQRGLRGALDGDFVVQAGRSALARIRALPEYGDATTVLAYVACDNELPTDRLIHDARAQGKTVFLPRGGDLGFVEHDPAQSLVPGRWGIPEPAAGRRLGAVHHGVIVLVPLLAWSPSGCRLGRGAGWYDRFLSRLGTGAVTVGLGYEVQRYDHLPQGPWDVDLNYIVTEERLVRCGA